MIVVRGDESADGDERVTTGTVFDDDRLAPFPAQPVGEQPRTDIGTAADAERDDEFDRPGRPLGLRRSAGRRRGAAAKPSMMASIKRNCDFTLPPL